MIVTELTSKQTYNVIFNRNDETDNEQIRNTTDHTVNMGTHF